MPDKKFYVQIPGTTQGMSVSTEDFEAKKDKLFNTYKDAVAVEMQDYTNGEDVGDSDFVVTIPGTTEPMQINAADFAKKKDKLFEQYPDAKVTRVRGVNYWGDKLQEGEDRIKALEEELKGIPEDVPLSEDPRAIQRGSIVGMQKLMVEKQRREAPNRERRGQIKREIEQIKRDREDNPAWQQYWEQQGKENDEARARIGQMQERHEAIMKEHSLDSALAAGDDDYLRIADRFYQDAKKMINAPSKYAEDNQGALGDFWQGIKDTGWNALSLVDFAQKLQEIPFLETVKKIQKSEGNNANVYDLIKNHPDRLYEMGMGDAEVEMLKAFVHKADVESGKSDLLTKSYQAGQSMAKSLGFMADFIAFGGIGDAASEAVAGGLVKLAGRRAVPKLAAESFGGLVKAAAMTPLMPSTYANFIGNLEQFNDAGGIDLSGKAMLKDVGDILIENVSETIGAKPLELIGMPLQKVKFPAWAKAMRNSPIAGALKQAGYNGFFEEMFEEWTGSALRTLTGVDKEALKDFRQMDQILVTAGSFAPVALLGGSVSAAQFHTASKSMRDKGAVIDGIIGGLQDENAKNAIKDSFDKTRDIETPEDLAHAMTDVYQQIVQNGGNEEQAFKAVMDYTEAASRYKVMNGMFEEQKDIERSQKLAEMDQQMGNTKWHHLGKNGSSYVRTITDDQGNERFVTGEDDTNLLVVDKQGKPGFISKESLATGVEDGTLTDSGEQYLFDYLDKQNRAVKQQEEQTRMADETKAAHEEVVRRALPDTPVNPEKPEEGIFRGIVGGRYVIQYPDGSSQDFSEEEIANKLGIRTVPETDAEIEAKEDAHEEKLENMHTAMNQFKGRHIVLPGIADMGYTLTGVVRNRNSESYPFSVFFRDADGHESGTGVSEEDMDALLAEMQAEQPEVQVPDVEPEVEVADNIPRDFRGNPLPMRQNEQTGETVVDEDALRENDIEAWVRYNDANPNRVVSSRDWLAFNIKKTASEVTKAADEITNAELNGVPARQKDAMKKALADKEKLLQSYESAMQRLTTPEDVIGDMPSYIADDQQPEAKEPAAAPSVRDFRGNPIPMADESEVDETAFFQQDPEAWMEWNNAQMNDGGEDSRNYVKGEIGRENKNISRLQKEYNGEKDFKKRKELRKKIQDAQQRIADLEQAVENVEKRMQRRSARELEPQSVDEVIALGIANFKGSIDRDELKRETGMSDAELQGFVGGFVKEGGMSIGQLAEAIKANDDTHLTDSISDDELRSDIIEFLRGSTKWSDITNYIANKRAVQKAEEERQVQEAIAAEKERNKPSFLDVVRTLYEKGKTVASSLFQRSYFDVAETPDFLKEKGLTGDKFTIKYGTIARHVGKDEDHDLTEQVWEALPDALQHPFAVTKYGDDGFRIYTEIQVGDGFVVVGAEVKNAGRNVEVNSISTVFAKDGKITNKEDIIYESETITPQQKSLLERPNSSQYPTAEANELEETPASSIDIETGPEGKQNGTTTLQDSLSENKDSEISETQAKISEEEAKVDTEPTEAQKEAGNYRKGHIKLDGYNISIEQPKGSIRSGIDEQGNPWSVTMNNTYGYIRGTEGVDGDHIDVFLSDNPEEGDIFVVDQIKPDGSFDEHKVMFGFPDMEAARKAYLSNYSEGWQGLGAITAVSREEFKKWVESSHRKTKPFAEYKSVTAEGEQHEESSTADQEEGSETVGYSVERRFHKKNGNYIYVLSFKDRLSKDEFKELKNRVKDFGGYYSSYGKGGFIFDKEDSARNFGDAVMDHTGEKLEEARPVSMEDIVQADAAAVQQTDETSQELGIDASMPVSYKGDGKPHTILMVTKTGEQVGAARFSKGRITTVVLNDLDNPGKMIYAKPEDIAQYVVPDIVPEEVNGYKAGDQVMYRDSAGLSSEIIDHFEKYGDTWFPVFKKKDGGRVQIGVWANVSPYVEQVEQNLQSEGSMEKPVNPSGNKLVTDEKYEELRRRMLAKLNGQMNMGIDPEILSIGVQMAVYHVEKGARKFVDFAKNMIADLGDAIRPYLKAFYNGARDLPEVEDAGLASEMTPYDEVRTFDVANFDKAVSNPIETAAEVVKEQEVQQQKEVAEKEIKKTRKSRKSSQNVLSLSLADGTSFTVDRSDYHTFLTPQAKEFFERLAKEDGRNFAFPELAYITYASENNVIIPASELEALPEFIEAERRIAEIGAIAKERTGSEALAISEDQVHALADRLLEEGSYVGKKDYSGEVAREKKAFVIIGRPAAGKSSVFANPLSKEHKARIIDSDTVKPWLEGYDGGYGANYVHGASVRVADEALIRAASLGENIIIPRIGGRSIISETVLPLRAVGYSVELCYNELPTEGSIMRAAARFVQTGRYLSLQYLNAIGEKPINTYRKFVTKSIGETINELSEREIQELRRRLGRLLGVEDRMAGASGPGGREVLSGVPETLGEGFRALLEHGEFGSDPSSDLLVFDGSEWKNNDVDYGMPPVTVWSSKSGEPFPGPKEGPKDNKNIKPSKKKHADEGMTLFDMMEENNNENEPETTDSTQGEGSPDRAMGGVSAVGDRVLGTDGSGQSDGTEAGGNRAGEPGVAGEEPQLLSTVGSGRGPESVVDSGSQGQPELSDGGSGVQGGDATDGRKAVRRDSQKAGQKKVVSKPAKKFTRNFHYGENASEIDNYTPAQRLKANIDAVEVLATMFSEGRPATDEEKETLSKFRGWGGIPFGHYYSTRQLRDSYSSDAHRLADAIDVLDPNGEKGLLPAISKAALTSYYTPSAIARTMNRFLALSGFKGGSMLDPSMGSGIFEGTLPEDIQQRTMINGVELDWLTGQIAKALYPDANVQIKGFEEAGTAMDAFDVVESNIPFGSIKVFDPTWKHDSTPVRKAAQGKIHNYFAVKMLESTKPGGLCVIMTSNAILDTEGNSLIREHIADQAEVLGIVRLPDNTFKGAGTSAVTDVLFLRKFRDSDDRNTTRDEEKYRTRVLQPFLSMTTKDAAKKTDGSSVKVSYNGYFGTHPEFMIGDVIAGNQYKADAFGLTSSMSTDEIADAMDKILEKKIVGSRKGKLFDTTKSEREVHEAIRESYVGNGDYISSGNIVEQDGKFGVVSMSKNKYGDVERNFQELPRLNGKAARIQAMFPIRTTMKKLVAEQIAGASNDTLDGLRKQLKESYDKFVKLYGRLQDSENTFLDDDIDGYMLRSLEKWREGEFVGLSDIFTKNTIKPAIDLSQAQDGQSAISVSLAEYGEIRPAFMEQMLGEKWYDLCKEMVFRIPFSEDRYETKDAYLSGDVKTKLEQARKAAEMDKSFQHNVDELEAVQPKDIPFDDISVHMGARWIPQEIYTQFLVDSFGISSWRGPKSGVLYSEVSDTYIVNVASSELGGAAQKWETRRRTPKDIFEAALSDKTIKVVDKDDEGKEYLNVAETEAANEKVQELRDSFEDWLPKNAERVKQVAALYNDKFNRTVLRKFDGSHLKTPGLMDMELRPHQKDAVWMLINNRGGIVDHMVGAGKTLVMQSAIMEMRRMGIAKKPMIVALKSTVAQITKEFIEAYPSARILAPTEKDFEKKRRKELLAKIALNDYDCVIISHENYVGLPHTEEVETQVIREQLAQLDAAIQFLYGQEDQSQLTKRQLKGLEKRKANLEAKMQALLSRKVDREFTFESLGVDYLFVDECQAFKSLPYVTSYQNVAGLGDAAGSQKAVALLNGVRYLQSLHQGDMGTTFLSGTTITNSLVEIYNLLQYLRPREMESLGFTTFDAWAGTFAQRSGELEYGVTQELKEKNRFRRFDNVPELARLYAEIADVRNDMNLKLPKPKPRIHIVTVPASEKLKEINAEVINMVRNKSGNYFYNMGAIKKPTTDKSPFGLLASGISTKAAISMKLLDPNAEEEGGKIHAVCENVAEIYKKFNDQKGTQLIFCDTGVPTKESKYDVYTDIIERLVNDYGIPRDEIVDIHVADTDKKRKELFTKVREGTVRVLIGGTKNMGTGVNVQTRLVALHHIDVPWTPADREQREGRGVRQGNIVAREFNDDNVDIYFYAAEESLDLYKYQLQDTKGKMFAQFKQGTIGSTERSFDEGSGGEDGTFDPAEIVALLSGNPVILEKSKQDKKVEKLRRAKRTFESEWHQRKSQYDSLLSYLYTQESFLRQNKRDIDSLEAGGFKKMEDGKYPTTVTVEDYSDYGTRRTFDKPKEAGEYIHKLLKKKGASVRLSGFGQKANIQMAEVASPLSGVPAYEWQVVLQAWSGIPYRAQLSEDDTAAGVAFRNVLQKVFSNRETYQKNIDETKHKLEGADPGEMVFPKQAELDEAESKKKELDAQYKALAPKEEKKPASSENPEESVSLQHYDINLEGTPEEKSENIHRTSVGEDLGTVGRRTGEVSGRDNDYGVWRRSYDISDGTGPGAGRISLDNLERLFRDTNINQEIVPLFEKVIALAKENGVIKTYFRTPKSGEIRGQAMYTGDVYFNPSILTAPEYTGESAVTILHELIHGLTISTLRSHELGNKLRKYGLNPDGRLTAEQKAAAKEIERIYKRLHDNLDTSGMSKEQKKMLNYRLVNQYEMVAGMSDQRFRDYLRSVEDGPTNLWERLKAAIKRILGIESGDTLTRLEKALDNLLDNFRIETFEDTSGLQTNEGFEHYSIRTKPAPTKTGIGYKVFYRGRDGKLYPPMVANPGGEDTPVGVWLDADAAPVAGQSKTGRPQVKAGGKGTQGGSGRLAYRPGWHLGEIPYAIQFNRINPETGRKELFPRDFVWAEVEYAADNDYQQEAEAEGTNASGNYQHSLAGLKRVPEDGFYRYRTNPNPETDPWIITGAMKVNRILTDEEVDELVRAAGREPQQRESDIVRNRIAETSDSRAIAGSLYDRYENQNGEDKPWMSEEDLFERVEAELPYDRETKPLFALIDEYRRLSDEDFDEGRRDFSGGEMSDLFNNFLSALKSYSEDTQVRNRIAGVEGLISNAEAAVNAITQEMKESVMEGQLMFREGNTQSPVQYSESISGKRDAVKRVAELCGVEIEFKPSSEMRFKGKPLAGRWINGRMQVCLEHCRDEADAVRTVLHEGVGHNGLRRLIGNENMREFCLELFQRLPEQVRKQIADAAVNKYGLNIAEAVEEYLAEQAEVMDFENWDYSRSFWDVVRDALRKVLSKIGIDVSLSERDVRWLMWQSYNANKQRDPLNEVKRQVVANKLGFTLTQQADKMEGIQIARNRMAQEDEMDAASDAYNEAAASLWNRMKETFVDQYQSVGKLVSAIEDATGKKAASFEDIRLALNRHSSKALATMQKWIGKYNTPMWDAIKELREKIGGTVNDVSRYVMLKHGLERNEVFAKRDAREYYQGIRDRAVNEIKASKDLSKDEKDQRIAKEDDRLEKHLKSIEAGTNAKYREFRQRDYGGLTSFYSEFDEVDPQRPGEGKERYNARLQKARHPKYTTVDENGRVVVDMAATEKAAADEVAAFERQSEGLTDKLWQRINAATKATLEHQYQSNMLSRKQYEQVRDMFKYYVPLRGFEDDTAQDLYSYYNEDQRGNFERPLIRATGRKTRAESPFGHIGAMASSGIAADMKNETKLSLYYFVSNRPNDLVTISDVWYEKTGETDEDGREVFKAVYPSFSEDLGSEEAKKAFEDWEEGMKEKAKSGLAFKGRKNLDLHNAVIHIDKGQKMEHVVKFNVGGRDMMMYINGNPRAAQAINGELNYNAENNFFVRAFNAVLRTMAALNTALNPEFWISNFQRDALFSLMSVDVKEGSKYRDAFAKNLVSGKTIYKMKKAFDEGTLGDSKDEQLFREFAENGGITGYTVVYDNEYWEKKLDEYAGKDRNVVARFNDVFKSISDFGEAVEIRTRFAAYKTSREMGKDIIGSVNDAKELTVNFNRKGSGKAITLDEAAKLTWRNGKPLSKPWQLVASMFSSISPLGRRMIMFFNAAVQGLNAMVKLYKTNPKRMAVWSAGYLAVGMINAVLHSMLDDDDDYLDIPDWERRNNLLLGGKGAYLKWALPQEARVFYALGDMVVNHALGREPHKYLAVELLDAVGEALPIDVASGVGAFLPSAAMPIIDIVRNKDYKGAKVHNDRRFYSEEERKDIPKWRDPLANTGGLYVGLAKVISRITGGDEYGAGWWNPDPNDIEHLVEGYTGGLGTTVEKMLQFFGDIAGGEFVVRDTPFLRRILSLNDERYRNTHTTELYYYYTNRAKDTKRKIREARKNGDADKLDDLYESDDFEIMNICESYDGLLKWYSDELKFTDDKQDRKAIMHEQDAVRKEMIQEISNIGK